jgi:hypothetical protein
MKMEQQQPEQQPDGGNPDHMIGYIDPNVSAKVKTYLLAAQHVVLNQQTAGVIKKLLASGTDPAMSLATFIGKTIDALETKLGPLEDNEHDQVAVHIAGWLVSSLQKMGMPGLDQPEGRQDLIGRILQALDGLTKGDQGAPEEQSPPEAAPEQQAPLGQFGGP